MPFEVCVYSDAILVFRLGIIQTLNILSFLVSWVFGLGLLGVTPAFDCDSSLSGSEVPSAPAQCFCTWRNLGPIYKWFIQNSVLRHKLKFCADLAQLPGPPECPSQAWLPRVIVLHWSTKGGQNCWTLLLYVPSECPLQSDCYWLSVLWPLRFPVGHGANY